MSYRGNPELIESGKGYTILEVLIFLAVSAIIFVSAMAAIAGRQQEVQFSQSVREFESKISDVMNDVTTSYYPTNNRLGCVVSSNSTTIILIDDSSSSDRGSIGSSEECLYIGKAIQFEPGDTEYSNSTLLVYNIAGKKFADTDKKITSKNIEHADPKAVALTGDDSELEVEKIDLKFGIEVTKVFQDNGVVNPTESDIEEFGIVGIISGFEGSSVASVSSNQTVRVGGISTLGDKLGLNSDDSVVLINKLNTDSSENEGYIDFSHSGIVICLKGPEEQRASVTIGSGGDNSVNLQIDDFNQGCLV